MEYAATTPFAALRDMPPSTKSTEVIRESFPRDDGRVLRKTTAQKKIGFRAELPRSRRDDATVDGRSYRALLYATSNALRSVHACVFEHDVCWALFSAVCMFSTVCEQSP